MNLGYLKKEGAHLQAASGGALEDNVKTRRSVEHGTRALTVLG